MSLIFTLSQGIAKMAVEGAEYEETDMYRIFKTTKERVVAARKTFAV